MLRSGQMLLAEAFTRLHLGTGLLIKFYYSLIRYFVVYKAPYIMYCPGQVVYDSIIERFFCTQSPLTKLFERFFIVQYTKKVYKLAK